MKILKDSLIYLIGELIAKALPFLLLPYLTRKLGVTGFGELSYFQTLFALGVIVFGMSQDGAVARYFYAYGTRFVPHIMRAGYAHTALCTLLALAFAWWQQSWILATVVLAAASQNVLSVQLVWRQCQQRARAYVIIQTAAGILTSLLTIVLLETSDNAPIALRFTAVWLGNAWVSLCAYAMMQRNMPNTNRSGSLKTWRLAAIYVFTFGWPMLLHLFSQFAKGQLDRMLIYHIFSSQQLGIYAAAYQLATVFNILLLALNKAIVPHFFQALKQGRLNAPKVRRLARWALLAAPVPALIGYVLPESLLLWLLGTQYVGVHAFWVVFLLGFGLTMPYLILVNFLFFQGQNKRIALISVLSTVIYLLALLLTATTGQLFAVAFAMLVGNAAILPMLYHFVREANTPHTPSVLR